MMDLFQDLYPYQHLLISLALGLLVGLQREWAITPMAGIRSFALISMLGTVCALLNDMFGQWFIGLGFIATLAITLIRRFTLSIERSPSEQKSLVTEVSVLIMYIIGVMVVKQPLTAASIACLMAAILQVKLELHAIAKRFDKNEIRSLMQFLVITLVIFPVVPNKSFGPNDALNLHNIWIMVILIVGIGLSGYIIYKFRGEKTGILWGGILGGIISSTATTFSYSRSSKKSESPLSYNALIILVAWATLYVRVYFELWAVAPHFNVSMPLLMMTLISSAMIFWVWRKSQKNIQVKKLQYNPTGLMTALTFALSYSLIIYMFSFLKENFSKESLSFISFISGIMDVDAITLSTGRLVKKGILSEQEGKNYFFLAIVANTIFKGLISLIIGGKELFKIIILPWFISLIAAISILIHSYY